MVPMLFLPPSVIAYGWVCEGHVSVAAICVMLFLAGFFSMCVIFPGNTLMLLKPGGFFFQLHLL